MSRAKQTKKVDCGSLKALLSTAVDPENDERHRFNAFRRLNARLPSTVAIDVFVSASSGGQTLFHTLLDVCSRLVKEVLSPVHDSDNKTTARCCHECLRIVANCCFSSADAALSTCKQPEMLSSCLRIIASKRSSFDELKAVVLRLIANFCNRTSTAATVLDQCDVIRYVFIHAKGKDDTFPSIGQKAQTMALLALKNLTSLKGFTRRVVPSLLQNEAVFLLGQLLIDTTFAGSNGLRNARFNCLSALLRLVCVFENAYSWVNPISKNTHYEMCAEQLVNSDSVPTLISICLDNRIAAYWGLSSQHFNGSVVNFLLPLCRCSGKFRSAAIGSLIPAENGLIERCMKAIESTDDKHLAEDAFRLLVVVTEDAAGRARLRDSGALWYLIDVFAGCFTNQQLYGDTAGVAASADSVVFSLLQIFFNIAYNNDELGRGVLLQQRRDFFASLTVCLNRYVAALGDSCECATLLSLGRITKEESVDCADGGAASESPEICDQNERTPSDSSTANTSTDASFSSGYSVTSYRSRSSVVNVTLTDGETWTPQLAITLCLRIISNLSRHKPFPTVMACQPQLLNALVNSVSKVNHCQWNDMQSIVEDALKRLMNDRELFEYLFDANLPMVIVRRLCRNRYRLRLCGECRERWRLGVSMLSEFRNAVNNDFGFGVLKHRLCAALMNNDGKLKLLCNAALLFRKDPYFSKMIDQYAILDYLMNELDSAAADNPVVADDGVDGDRLCVIIVALSALTTIYRQTDIDSNVGNDKVGRRCNDVRKLVPALSFLKNTRIPKPANWNCCRVAQIVPIKNDLVKFRLQNRAAEKFTSLSRSALSDQSEYYNGLFSGRFGDTDTKLKGDKYQLAVLHFLHGCRHKCSFVGRCWSEMDFCLTVINRADGCLCKTMLDYLLRPFDEHLTEPTLLMALRCCALTPSDGRFFSLLFVFLFDACDPPSIAAFVRTAAANGLLGVLVDALRHFFMSIIASCPDEMKNQS